MEQNNKASQNSQTHGHNEGPQQNIAAGNEGRNNSQSQADMMGGRAGKNNQAETESDRANENEDEGVRGGNSSI
jgi:hypothetical protein